MGAHGGQDGAEHVPQPLVPRPDADGWSDDAMPHRIGSTGLYPYAVSDPARQVFDARQFPRSSGYPEDAATALAFGLRAAGLVDTSDRPVRVRQGRAMSRPSEITI
jgi:predicted PhzF superfamily epimerase YddE/YHI9